MKSHSNYSPALWGILLIGLLLTTPALAATDENYFVLSPDTALFDPPSLDATVETVSVSTDTPVLGASLTEEDLDALRGGSDSTNSIVIRGNVDNNSANNINSGDNVVSGGAFANASGINTVIQNSGSNVLIQNATAVVVQFGVPTP